MSAPARRPASRWLGTAACVSLAAAAMVLASDRNSAVVHAADEVTWRAQVAPIIYRNCTSCHHTGGSGPFALETFADARRWGKLMQQVTTSRYMPPWLPADDAGAVHLEGDRRLSTENVAILRRWAESGMPEGTGPTPTAPTYANDWALGTPDLVVEMPTAMQVPAAGTDLFENFVLPVTLDRTRWVRAMEIKPGSPQVTHHANVVVDRTASVRRAHPQTWQQGIPGMDLLVDGGDAFDPDSHFLFWKPDSTALIEPAGMPWRLDPGNDLVLNMHLKPTGKPESVRARIGLYFTDQPATAQPMLLQLEDDAVLDIPADDPDFVVEDKLTLPVAVDVLGIYPHAHYLGKRMEAWATLPTGERRTLVLIRDWDIDRQSVYRLAQPLTLPLGSIVHMRYSYDNSAANPRNPNSPPIRVRAGNRSADEMAHFWLQVLPHPATGSAAKISGKPPSAGLGVAAPDPRIPLERAWMQDRLRKDPADDLATYNLASLDLQQGDPQAAVAGYRRLLAERPNDARTTTSLGSALAAMGDTDGARTAFRAAIQTDPAYADAAFDLASLDLRSGDAKQAATEFSALANAHPEDRTIRTSLGAALAAAGDPVAAKREFNRALAGNVEQVGALLGLGELAVQENDLPAAELYLHRVLAVRDDLDAHRLLALAASGEGDLPRALAELEAARRLAPDDLETRRALAQVNAQLGHLPEAITEQRAATQLSPNTASDWNDLAVMEARSGDKPAARRDFEHALTLEPNNQAARNNLAHL